MFQTRNNRRWNHDLWICKKHVAGSNKRRAEASCYSTCVSVFCCSSSSGFVHDSIVILRQIKTHTFSPSDPRPPEPDLPLHQLRILGNGQAPGAVPGASTRTAHTEITTEPRVEVFKWQLAGKPRTHIPELLIFLNLLSIPGFSNPLSFLHSGEPQHAAQHNKILRGQSIVPVGIGQVVKHLLQVLIYSSSQDDNFVIHAGIGAVVVGQGAPEPLAFTRCSWRRQDARLGQCAALHIWT